MFNLRTLIVAIAAWLCLVHPHPAWFTAIRSVVDHAIFRLAMDFSALPRSQTQMTVVHVSPVEYESWLADVPGAERLETLLTTPAEGPALTVGMVLERPLSLIQSQAEALLADVQQGRRSKDHLFDEVNALLQRRSHLVERLKSADVVLGVENRFEGGGPRVVSTASTLWVDRVPPWVRAWLWPQVPEKIVLDDPQTVFDYAPIWAKGDLARPLIGYADEQIQAGFELAFLRAAADTHRGANDAEAAQPITIEWLPEEGFRIGQRTYQASVFGEVISLYGAHSNLRSPLRQLSLDAALSAQDLNGWLLVGKDGSPELDRLAQTITAIADGAVLVEPLWWSPVKKLLVVLAALLICFALPRFSRYWKLTSTALMLMALTLTVILGQSIYRLWLPVAELLIFLVAGLGLIILWQKKAARDWQMRQQTHTALLNLADQLTLSGSHERALATLDQCRSDAAVLERYYSLGETLTQQRKLAPALSAFSSIQKQKRRFRDVPAKIQELHKQLETQRLLAGETPGHVPLLEHTQVVEGGGGKSPTLGRYEIRKELGRGANGTVFLGFDPKIDREVAIKTLHYQAHDADALALIRERFFKEARAVGRLAHPNIVSIYDVGEEESLAYMTMDYARGRPLSEYTLPELLLPIEEVYRITAQVADALHYAHQHQVIHRDVKPSNIIYAAEPFQVRVTDFGIARFVDHAQTHTGEILGSPLYMAPEQLRGESLSHSADIFSLGVTFYQLLTGYLPFQGENIANLSYAITQANHKSVRKVRKDLPSSATRISNIALQKKPDQRFASAEEFALALRKACRRDFGLDIA